ncbi:MAG: hypothetical protein EOM26_09735 [Alphaproteobacteria bacterium]|nr:hypothetical protein [Alphaproteobacteria bacterium]
MTGTMTIVPRFNQATAILPGDPLFWKTALDQSDLFAYRTANEGKGGPFGAQLWLVHPESGRHVLVGTPDAPEDSNAVVSKGIASAHAEAENLSPEKRRMVKAFLGAHVGEGWKLVQVSSGESCPSCRSRQVLFARELIAEGLLPAGGFHVVFKATYDQTREIAGFNDSAYDEAFRAVARLGLLSRDDGLFALETAFQEDAETATLKSNGALVFNAVHAADTDQFPEAVRALFAGAGDTPVAIVVSASGAIMASGADTRAESGLNVPEETAIVAALHKAATCQREKDGKFEAWNLEGARLYTNIRDIGPLGYAESLWYNLSAIHVATDFTSEEIDRAAQEMPGIANSVLFAQVAAEYNQPDAPVSVTHGGDPEEASVAHLLWQAKMRMEAIRQRQAMRLAEIGGKEIVLIDGSKASIAELVEHSTHSSNYDGKRADAPSP